MLYEVAILELPTKKQAEDGAVERLVMPPTPIVAKDEMTAGILAVKGKTFEAADDRLQVLVRPFAVRA